jgi:hypothetical protein
MQRGRGNNIATVPTDIDARPYAHFVGDRLAGMLKEQMAPTTTCQAPDRLWKVVRMGLDELLEAFLATVARVDIEDHDPGHSPSSNTNVGVRPSAPPLANLGFFSTRIMKTMRRARMLPGVGTEWISTAAPAMHDPVDRKDMPAMTGVGERRVEHVGFGCLVIAMRRQTGIVKHGYNLSCERRADSWRDVLYSSFGRSRRASPAWG